MSKELEPGQILTLPLFPLPLVMLPKEVLPLHIFEARYRQMLDDISAGQGLFGINLFEGASAILDRPPVGSIGSVAKLRETETLPDGRSNILTTCIGRYRVLEYVDADEPYLVVSVEVIEDERDDSQQLNELAEEVFVLFDRMARAAFKLSGNRGEFPEMQRTDPESMSFLIAAAFNFENERKYSLLEMTSTSDRLHELKRVLESSAPKVEESAAIKELASSNGHSKKRIDL